METVKKIAFGCLKQPIDDVSFNPEQAREWFRRIYFQLPWYEVYNLLQFVLENITTLTSHRWNAKSFTEVANDILAVEMSGYRFIKGEIVPISNSQMKWKSRQLTKQYQRSPVPASMEYAPTL
ncbi:MAG: hypothetical protein HYZ81_27390 [Nitrospinae bacterium]|nr:hypothetical protein [Nitrospinota bacterium]